MERDYTLWSLIFNSTFYFGQIHFLETGRRDIVTFFAQLILSTPVITGLGLGLELIKWHR
jgi:hypothetical protein